VVPPPPTTAPPNPLEQPLSDLRGMTSTRLQQLQRLGLTTVRDVLFHFPRSYEDLTDIRPIPQLSAERVQTTLGEVVEIGGRQLADGRTIVSIVISDGQHCLEGVWFNQPWAASRFRYGQQLSFSGKPKWYRDHWQMSNPRVQHLDGLSLGKSPGIVPIYPLTEGLRNDQLWSVMRRTVDAQAANLVEILPAELRRRHSWPDVHAAIRNIHAPKTVALARTARRRFVFEEFLLLQLALALRRREVRDRRKAPILKLTPTIDTRIRRLFPFQLTGDQARAVSEICQDLASDRPMQRLLQADVGAGKTAVAVYALLVTVANKHQAVLMAPTEVLARQHWLTLECYLAHSRVRRLLLTGGLSGRQRRVALAEIRSGQVDLVVGTQAVIEEDVQFSKLGLVVIDEQHRFGVGQRLRVRKLGTDPHYLVMTATPIPRTVALTVFGDLDTSIIHELPPGRQPVKTRWIVAEKREQLYARLREQLRAGRQAFVVCPLVEESEAFDLKAAERQYEELKEGPFREFSLGLLHGRQDVGDKEKVMEQFRSRDIDMLVSTTIIEVGVDVPNATLMVVEHAERFGLSQLHQLRGRISRGAVAGECYLFANPTTDDARDRLQAFTKTTDGFKLAEEDARLRGLGEFFGTRQHGWGELRVADLTTDREVLQLARKDAIALVAADAGLRRPEHAPLRQAVLQRYGQTMELAEIG